MTPRESVEAVLTGAETDRIPFTIYENKIPQCAAERKLRNQGLCIVRRDIEVYKMHLPNVTISSHTYTENGKKFTRTEYNTPVGTLYTIIEPSSFTFWRHKMLFARPEDYKPLLYMIEDMQFEPNYPAFQCAQNADGGDSLFRSGLGLEPMQQLIVDYMGTEVFCMEWYDNRDEILKLFKDF